MTEVADYYIKYQFEQLKGLVDFLERQTEKPLDNDRLWETIRLGDEVWRLWYEVDRLRQAIPAPMPSQDHFNVMVSAHFLCGTYEAVAFFRELYEEVKVRVESKTWVIENEKYRLHDPVEVPARVKDPVEYIAWRSFLRRTQRFDKAKQRSGSPAVERLLEFIEDYKIDGVVFHACRSCRATSLGQIHAKNLLQKYTNIPSMQLVSDMVDLRDYSEAQWKAQINAFVEAVATHKIRRGKLSSTAA